MKLLSSNHEKKFKSILSPKIVIKKRFRVFLFFITLLSIFHISLAMQPKNSDISNIHNAFQAAQAFIDTEKHWSVLSVTEVAEYIHPIIKLLKKNDFVQHSAQLLQKLLSPHIDAKHRTIPELFYEKIIFSFIIASIYGCILVSELTEPEKIAANITNIITHYNILESNTIFNQYTQTHFWRELKLAIVSDCLSIMQKSNSIMPQNFLHHIASQTPQTFNTAKAENSFEDYHPANNTENNPHHISNFNQAKYSVASQHTPFQILRSLRDEYEDKQFDINTKTKLAKQIESAAQIMKTSPYPNTYFISYLTEHCATTLKRGVQNTFLGTKDLRIIFFDYLDTISAIEQLILSIDNNKNDVFSAIESHIQDVTPRRFSKKYINNHILFFQGLLYSIHLACIKHKNLGLEPDIEKLPILIKKLIPYTALSTESFNEKFETIKNILQRL